MEMCGMPVLVGMVVAEAKVYSELKGGGNWMCFSEDNDLLRGPKAVC